MKKKYTLYYPLLFFLHHFSSNNHLTLFNRRLIKKIIKSFTGKKQKLYLKSLLHFFF